jgi:hypothetical protein
MPAGYVARMAKVLSDLRLLTTVAANSGRLHDAAVFSSAHDTIDTLYEKILVSEEKTNDSQE